MTDAFFKQLGISSDQMMQCAGQTLYMLFAALFLGSIAGLILAFALVLTNKDGILRNRWIFICTNTFINIVRSVPFIILMVFIMPTHLIGSAAFKSSLIPASAAICGII